MVMTYPFIVDGKRLIGEYNPTKDPPTLSTSRDYANHTHGASIHMSQPFTIVHNPAASRFELDLNGELAVLDYQLTDQKMFITHTGVPVSHRGQGIAAELVESALAHAREHAYQVVPICSYVVVYLRRHPEYVPLTRPQS